MESNELLEILERANQIASTTALDDLLNQMLDLIQAVCAAETGTLYLLDPAAGQLVFAVVHDAEGGENLTGQRMSIEQGIAGAAFRQRAPIVVEDVATDPRWCQYFSALTQRKLRNALSFPLLLRGEPIGVVQVFNYRRLELPVVQMLGNRMASEVEKARLLRDSREHNERLVALVDIIGHISSSLDPAQVLQRITDYARQLLDAEAVSLFLVEEQSQDLLLRFNSSVLGSSPLNERVPAGKGVIGHVVSAGQTIFVRNAQQDNRFFASVDRKTGFTTRSILAVPLRTRDLELGEEQGVAAEEIIGGLEALNKVKGNFTQEDISLLETLAQQAATVLQIANLFTNVNELFLDAIRSFSAAIDAKDPYTEGHSQRVSDFAVEIARELALSQDAIHHIRITGLLHDIGKIGVPDEILQKPGKLTDEEYARMKQHPSIGENILSAVRLLQAELPGISQHHERMDGQGYPRALAGEEISLAGRIVAVADVFDALTSERPYHAARPAAQAFLTLLQDSGSHFDTNCVAGLMRAYQKGRIIPQSEMHPAQPAPE